ncbi:MAG: hypothetical protein AAFX85_13260 [Pseudomonadota bacterium]
MRTHPSFLVTLALLSLAASTAHAEFPGLNPASSGFNHVLLSIADGEFDPFSPNPDVPGCFAAVCDGNYFVTEVAQWTPDEFAQREAEAKVFFLTRFGLDVDNLVASGQAMFSNTYADPRLNYRVRFMASEHVHELGWQKHDWALVLFLLEDLTLGGEFEGVVAPAGTLLAFGEYWIQKSRLDRRGEAPRLIELHAPRVRGGMNLREQRP